MQLDVTDEFGSNDELQLSGRQKRNWGEPVGGRTAQPIRGIKPVFLKVYTTLV